MLMLAFLKNGLFSCLPTRLETAFPTLERLESFMHKNRIKLVKGQ
jgi:hypothetical protein